MKVTAFAASKACVSTAGCTERMFVKLRRKYEDLERIFEGSMKIQRESL